MAKEQLKVTFTFVFDEDEGGWDEDLVPSIMDYLDENWDTVVADVTIDS